MPTYEYRCPEGHEFEHFYRTISAAESTLPCPVCGAVGQRKVSGGAGLLFKGSGFYITDYGKDGKKDQRKSEAKPEGGSAADSAKGSSDAGKSGGEKSPKGSSSGE
jgi:putative FmdB family regulatory protein